MPVARATAIAGREGGARFHILHTIGRLTNRRPRRSHHRADQQKLPIRYTYRYHPKVPSRFTIKIMRPTIPR